MKDSFQGLFARAEETEAYWSERAVLRATEEICIAMERAHVSRAELARRLGSSPAYVTKILRGNANFTLETLARIAFVLSSELQFSLVPRKVASRRVVRSKKAPARETTRDRTVALSPAGLRRTSRPSN